MTRLERLKCELSIRRQEYEFIKRDICRQETYKDYSKTRAQLAAAVSNLTRAIERLGGDECRKMS